MAAVLAAFVLLAWSAFATFRAIDAMDGDVARMERQVAQMQADVAAAARRRPASTPLCSSAASNSSPRCSRDEADADAARRLAAAGSRGAGNAVAAPYARVDGMQLALAERARDVTRQRVSQTARAIRTMGINPTQFLRAGQGAVGGPFEEVQQAGNADPRFRELFTTWRQLDQLEQGVAAIPSAHPIRESIAFTSGYGVRSDPFRGRAAMHAGIDLAGPLGTPIYATADGIVGRSEWNNGGYGNLVEINHGQGIQTRYGHLSRFVDPARPARPPRRAGRL